MRTLEVRFTSEPGLHADQGVNAKQRNGRTLRGYAAVFHSWSADLGGFKERILPGAFADSIRRRDVRALWHHDDRQLLGRTRNGTLKLQEDQHGLAFELVLPRTQLGEDVALLIERGDVSKMSFGFSVPKGGDEWGYERGQTLRTLREINLYEVSPVGEPAYSATSVSLREALAVLDDELVQALARRRARLEALCAGMR